MLLLVCCHSYTINTLMRMSALLGYLSKLQLLIWDSKCRLVIVAISGEHG